MKSLTGIDPVNVKVSVAIVTYNHEAFIARAIEGVLMQQTDFGVELVIGEDCSTDGTRAIVQSYRDRYPGRIRLLLHERNQGAHANFIATLAACREQYIALCEGDDYWTDPLKLQKQIDFLNFHPDCVICAHNTQVISDNNDIIQREFHQVTEKEIFGFDDLLAMCFFHTSSVIFRNQVILETPDFFIHLPSGDWNLFLFLAQHGNIGYINEIMSVYRIHSGGTYSQRPFLDRYVEIVEFYRRWYDYLGLQYHDRIVENLQRHFKRTGEILAFLGFKQNPSIQILEKQEQEWVNRMLAESCMPDENAKYRKCFMSGFYGALGFLFYKSDKLQDSQSSFLRAMSNDWNWVRNIGVWSILGESILGKKFINGIRKLF